MGTPSATAPSGASRARMNIGEVLDRLRPDFPGVTIPKIRFLEDKGLIKPERTPAGYRKFSHEDVDRLRYVLRMQRDHYLVPVVMSRTPRWLPAPDTTARWVRGMTAPLRLLRPARYW